MLVPIKSMENKRTHLSSENSPKNIFTARRNCKRTIISKILVSCYPCYVLWINTTQCYCSRLVFSQQLQIIFYLKIKQRPNTLSSATNLSQNFSIIFNVFVNVGSLTSIRNKTISQDKSIFRVELDLSPLLTKYQGRFLKKTKAYPSEICSTHYRVPIGRV